VLSSDLPGVDPATLNGMILYYRLTTKWKAIVRNYLVWDCHTYHTSRHCSARTLASGSAMEQWGHGPKRRWRLPLVRLVKPHREHVVDAGAGQKL
jgi:hypothetical protein